MSDETQGSGPNSGTTETKKGPVKINKAEQKRVQKSQAAYKGNSFKDKVKVVFTQSTNHHAEGDTKMVHPTTAEVFKAKGIAKLAMILLMFTLAFAAPVAAQTVNFSKITSTNDTITNAGVDSMIVTFTTPGQYHFAVATIWPQYTRLSGTAAGTMILYEQGLTSGSWHAVGDTLTLTNVAAQNTKWTITDPAVKRYMIVTSGGSSVSAIASANIILVKE